MALLSHSDINSSSSSKEAPLGAMQRTADGRTFRYVKAGGTNLARGKLVVAPTVVANHVNMSFASAPADGDTEVTVTLGATAATADQYADGWLVVQDGTGEGRAYHIEGNEAADASASCKVFLTEAVDTAGATGESNVDLLKNPWDGVVISVADQADQPVGVPVSAITADEYGWVQTGGMCSVLFDEAVTNGSQVTTGTSTVGAVEAQDGAGEPVVGFVAGTAGVDTEYQAVYLTLDSVVE